MASLRLLNYARDALIYVAGSRPPVANTGTIDFPKMVTFSTKPPAADSRIKNYFEIPTSAKNESKSGPEEYEHIEAVGNKIRFLLSVRIIELIKNSGDDGVGLMKSCSAESILLAS